MRSKASGTGPLDPQESATPDTSPVGTPSADDAAERDHEAADTGAPERPLEGDDAEPRTPAGDEVAPPVRPPDAPPESAAAEEPPRPEAPTGEVEADPVVPASAPEPAASSIPAVAAASALVVAPAPPDRSASSWGILCRVVGPGSVAGHGVRLDGRPAHFWESGARGYFSQASIDKLPHLLLPESS